METVTEEQKLERHEMLGLKDLSSWALKGFKLTERVSPIPLTEPDLEIIRVSAGGAYALVRKEQDCPTVSAYEWEVATMGDLNKLRDAYKNLEMKLKLEKQFSNEASFELNRAIQREMQFTERVAQLEARNANLKSLATASQAQVEELTSQLEQTKAKLHSRNMEIKNFNLRETIERAEIEKKHFENMEQLRQKLSEALHQKAADAEQWSRERDAFQADIATLKNRLERFLATEVTLCRLVSLCTHVQDAIQALLVSGRLFDATFRAVRRQHRTLEQEHAEQLNRAVGPPACRAPACRLPAPADRARRPLVARLRADSGRPTRTRPGA